MRLRRIDVDGIPLTTFHEVETSAGPVDVVILTICQWDGEAGMGSVGIAVFYQLNEHELHGTNFRGLSNVPSLPAFLAAATEIYAEFHREALPVAKAEIERTLSKVAGRPAELHS